MKAHSKALCVIKRYEFFYRFAYTALVPFPADQAKASRVVQNDLVFSWWRKAG
jgi:hypothetical protein